MSKFKIIIISIYSEVCNISIILDDFFYFFLLENLFVGGNYRRRRRRLSLHMNQIHKMVINHRCIYNALYKISWPTIIIIIIIIIDGPSSQVFGLIFFHSQICIRKNGKKIPESYQFPFRCGPLLLFK